MARLVDLLQELGFSEYESRAYVALLAKSPLTGYEVAKASKVPRANVYAVLQKLEDRGAALRVETSAGRRYAPVAPEELTRRLGSRFQQALKAARSAMAEASKPQEAEFVWNARGYEALLEHAQAVLEPVRQRLLVALWPAEAAALAEPLAAAEARGVEITTLCLAACASECGGCRGRIHRYRVTPAGESRTRWLVLVPDGSAVVAAEIGAEESALTVRTTQRLWVNLAEWYIRHSIALAAVMGDVGGELKGLLKPETQAILEDLGPGPERNWLEHMLSVLVRAPATGA